MYDKQYNKAINNFKDKFSKIKPIDYNIVCEDIASITDYLRTTEKGLKLVIKTLTTMEKSEYLTTSSKFIISSKLQSSYLLNQNYAKASRYILNTLTLSKKRNDKFNQAKSLIDLGVLFSYIDGENTAIKSIKDGVNIKIFDKKQKMFVDVYGNLNIAEIYAKNEEYNNAKKYIEKVEKYQNYIEKNNFYDLKLLINTIKSSIYISENNFEEAKICLDKARNFLNKENIMIGNRKSIYQLAIAKYYEGTGNINGAIKIYKEVLKDDVYAGDKEQDIKDTLISLIRLLEEKNRYREIDLYTDKLLDIIKQSESTRYRDYSYYIIEQSDKEYKLEHENNIIKILFIILLVSGAIFIIIYKSYKKRLTSMKYLTLHDKLTDTYNRAFFDSKYKEFLQEDVQFFITMIDIDNFKRVNDTYGHQFGDNVLKTVTLTMKKLLKEDAYLCRYGGEEFVIISKYKLKEEVLLLSNLVKMSIEEIKWNKKLTTTVSIGVSFSNIQHENTLKKADENLYIAKNTGKNKVVVDEIN